MQDEQPKVEVGAADTWRPSPPALRRLAISFRHFGHELGKNQPGMDTVRLPSVPLPNARVARSESVELKPLKSEACRVNVGAATALPLGGAVKPDCVDGYESRKSAGSRSQCLTRCCGCGIFVLLIVLGIILTAWNVQMAMSLSQVGRDANSTNASATARRRLELISTIKQHLAFARASQPSSQRVKTRTLVHLGSDYYPSSEPDLSYQHVNRWLNSSRYGSIVAGNVSNAGGGITIGESGYYFVYSQVSYVLAVPDAAEGTPLIDHKLIRLREASLRVGGGGDVLARSQKTRCWNSQSDASFMSSTVGAVIHLDKGDVVTVEVDRVRFVWHNPQKTFVGAYLLPS